MLHFIVLRPILVLVAVVSVTTLFAQSPGLVLYGTVRDLSMRDSIPFPVVQVEELLSNAPPMPIVTNGRGRYEIALSERLTYVVRYSAPGKVSKSVQLELSGASEEDWSYGFGMNIDVTLLDSLPGIDYSVLSEPFGISRFNAATGFYEWDIEYTRSMSDRQKVLMNTYHERVQQEGTGR